jgi:hypothetical protein
MATLALMVSTTIGRAQTLTIEGTTCCGIAVTPDQPVVGQTFIALNTGLLDFSLFAAAPAGQLFDFRLGVATLVGNVKTDIFLSDVLTAMGTSANMPVTASFTTPLELGLGQTYFAFIQHIADPFGGWSAQGLLDSYSGGQLYASNAHGTFVGGPTTDLRMTAHFTALDDVTVAPEPATMVLLATGLAGVAAAARRRRATSRVA